MDLNTLGQEQLQGTVTLKGATLPGIPIGTPVPLSDFVVALAASLTTSGSPVEVDSDQIIVKAGTSPIVGCMSGIQTKYATTDLQIVGNSSLRYSWDFTDMEAGLQPGYSLKSSRIVVLSGDVTKGALVDSASPTGSAPISLPDFPLTVTVEAVVTTPCGLLKGSRSFYEDNSSNLGTRYKQLSFNNIDTVTSEDRTLTEVLTDLESTATQNQSTTVSIGGTPMSLVQAISYLNTEIENLKNS